MNVIEEIKEIEHVKSEIKKLISKNKLQEALEITSKIITKETATSHTLMILNSKFNQIRLAEMNGTMHQEFINAEFNRIVIQFLQLLDDLEYEDFNIKNLENLKKEDIETSFWKKLMQSLKNIFQ